MTLAAFASPLGSPMSGEPAYVPGVCNIGPDEITHRRRAGHLGVLATVALLGLLLAADAPPMLRFTIALPAAIAASGYLQAWLKFCAAFGWLGVLNFGHIGRTERVEDARARSRDRQRALQISLASGAIGAAVGLVAVLLPV